MSARKPKADRIYRTVLTVEGSGEFPVDMLRYDRCCPDTGGDVMGVIGRTSLPRRVRLLRFSIAGDKAEAARWKSFGWTVLSEEPAL